MVQVIRTRTASKLPGKCDYLGRRESSELEYNVEILHMERFQESNGRRGYTSVYGQLVP